MSSPRKPRLPAAVEERMLRRVFATVELRVGETALDRFLAAVQKGDMPQRRDIEIVAAQLSRVLGGQSFGRAFGIQAGQGRKASRDTQLRDQVICAEMEELRREGYRLEDAAELVAARYQLSPETVSKMSKAAAKEHHELMNRLDINERRGKN